MILAIIMNVLIWRVLKSVLWRNSIIQCQYVNFSMRPTQLYKYQEYRNYGGKFKMCPKCTWRDIGVYFQNPIICTLELALAKEHFCCPGGSQMHASTSPSPNP